MRLINHVPERTKPKAPIVAALAAITDPIGSCNHCPSRNPRVGVVAGEVALSVAVMLLPIFMYLAGCSGGYCRQMAAGNNAILVEELFE